MKDTKKKPDSGIQILAPINGKVIPLEQVPDPVFAEKNYWRWCGNTAK